MERYTTDEHVVSLVAAAEREFNVGYESGVGSCIADPIDIQRVLKCEIEKGHLPVVIIHGGTEYEHLPPPSLRKMARWLVECGALAVVTHHPHVPGCVDYWKGRPIAYSMGDFWMPRGASSSNSWRMRGYAVQLELDVTVQSAYMEQIPYVLDYDRGLIRDPDSDEQAEFETLQKNGISILSNDTSYQQWWDSLIESHKHRYLRNYSGAVMHKALWAFVWRHVLRWLPASWALRQLNGLQCISHRELWMASLRRYISDRRRN